MEKPAVHAATSERAEAEGVRAARQGDRQAFELLCRDALPRLRAVLRRMVGDRAQTDDLVQDTLTKAWASIAGFDGRSRFSTWLCSIAANLAVDFLRGERRWRERAQVAYANACATSPDLATEVGGVLASDEFRYDALEHVAFCFVCVSRALPPELQAALVLREVEQLSNRDAARALGVSESVLRHRLAEARSTMERAFDGLCSLVNKRGVCYQCTGLREAVAAPERQGELAPARVSLGRRLKILRDADLDDGRAQRLHDLFWHRIAAQERIGGAAPEPTADCAPPGGRGG